MAYTVAVYAGKELKKKVPIERWYPLPGDKIPPRRIAKVKKLTKEEIKERWAKAGQKIPTERQIERALGRRSMDNSKAIRKLINE